MEKSIQQLSEELAEEIAEALRTGEIVSTFPNPDKESPVKWKVNYRLWYGIEKRDIIKPEPYLFTGIS